MANHAKITWSISAALLIFLIGCSEPVGRVSGIVTYKGKPVSNGSISLQMKSKGIVQTAKLDSTGSYVMAEPMLAGTYHVTYVPPTPEPQDPAKGPPPNITSIVPAKFNDLEKSTLTVEVKSGKNEVPIDFKD